ncbi:MAG: uroporphyrinogen decarboxylase family protein [Candidatus Brocadiia bacterium]
MDFEPDYRHFEAVMENRRPRRLPIYEHIICPEIMETVLETSFAELIEGGPSDIREYFRHYTSFFRRMTYDVVSFEVGITDILPEHGAITGGGPGPVQTPEDFESYPWDELVERYWDRAAGRFDALCASLPAGMKAVGGVGNGLFEISEDLVGLERLPMMQVDYPDLYSRLYRRIGDLMVEIWEGFLRRYSRHFVACRFGDDLGYRSSLLTNPRTVREHIIPHYSRIIDLVHSYDLSFLWHSCGNIFEIMDDAIEAGIDAKHSNEDAIAPFDRWIELYGDRIGLLGGFDMDFLGRRAPEDVYQRVVEDGMRYRRQARGYALGSGNSIPDFIPVENYLAMIRAAKDIRNR